MRRCLLLVQLSPESAMTGILGMKRLLIVAAARLTLLGISELLL